MKISFLPINFLVMITVQNTINLPIEKVWELWTTPEHIKKWNVPSQDWHNPFAENDLKAGGKFKYTMGTKDGSVVFDFEGIYTKVENYVLEYTLTDQRTATVRFESIGNQVKITEMFEPETANAARMQEQFCKAVIANFKKYAETN
jgi:uncharacterized protein YndB with AHSA1/START domain